MAESQVTATRVMPDPMIGRIIAGRFKIVSLIARGGMGKVYRAEQAPLGRVCAVKVLNPNYNGDADPEFHRRFFREASITSKITHPNSVTIFDYGKTDDDIYFMAMEYLEGQTLHQALREGGVMSEYRVARITAQICRALREAHKLGVIHRDLKPANIFLTRPTKPAIEEGFDEAVPRSEEDEDFVKVLDFGLVKHLSERPEEQLTQTGLFMGSPKYMAPEQIQGGNVDARTDIYALGIMMYELLAGKVPFERATSVNILMAHVGEPPPPMRTINPQLVCSPAFEELVMSCLAKDPNQRLPTMDAMLQALRRLQSATLTGQLAAFGGASGQFPVMPAGGSSGPMPALTSGSFVLGGSVPPMSMMDAASVRDPRNAATVPPLPRRTSSHSLRWIALGFALAVVAGGGIGMVALRATSGTHATPAPHASTTSAALASASAPAPVAPPASAAPSEPVRTLDELPSSFTVTTEPPGASVREDGRELCARTPCEFSLGPDGKATSRTHRLSISLTGYRTEQRTVRASDAPLTVRLVRSSAPRTTPPATGNSSTKGRPTPDGFKDVPY